MAQTASIQATILIALVLMVAGCGGGSSASDAPPRVEFIKQANAICKDTQEAALEKVHQYLRAHPGGFERLEPEIEKDRMVMALAHSAIVKEARRLAALPAPEGDEKKIAAIVAAIEAGLNKAEEDPLSTIAGTYRRAIKLATAYGISQCYEIV